jgi:hypothetical protein
MAFVDLFALSFSLFGLELHSQIDIFRVPKRGKTLIENRMSDVRWLFVSEFETS